MSQIVFPRIPEIEDPKMQGVYIDQFLANRAKKNQDKNKVGLETLMRLTDGLGVRFGSALDIACGCGRFADQLAQVCPGLEIIGIDASERAIEIARETFKRTNLEFRKGNVYDLSDYEDLDFVSCMDSLHHFNDLEGALTQIYEALKPDGVFYFMDYNRENIPDRGELISTDQGVVQLANYVYQWRVQSSREEFLDDFLNDRIYTAPDGSQKIMLLSVLSTIAAYTPVEVREVLQKVGFRDIDVDTLPEVHRYDGYARK